MKPTDLALARCRDKMKAAFTAHAAALRCSKLNRSYHERVVSSLGDRRRRSAQALDSAARHRRAAKRALRQHRLTKEWAHVHAPVAP